MEHEENPFGISGPAGSTDEFIRQLLAKVEPENIRWSAGHCEIVLGRAWPEMFAALPELGEVLVVTGNSAAILGMTGDFPVVEFCDGGCHARGWNGALAYELVPWTQAVAVIRRQVKGASPYFLEFRDITNSVIHKICLTSESNLPEFAEWVKAYQANDDPDLFAVADFPPARWKTRPQRHWLDYESIDSVHPEMLEPIFEEAGRRELEITVRVNNDGAIQCATFIPRRRTPLQQWWFLSDDRTALHFDPAGLTDVVIHYVNDAHQSEPGLNLQCFDDDGNLSLSLSAPTAALRKKWNQLLADTAKLR